MSKHPDAERDFQAKRAASTSIVPTPPAVLERYRSLPHPELYPLECVYDFLGDVQGKTVLDFGGGEGANAVALAAYGAHVTAMDLSPDLVELAKHRAELDRVSVMFSVGDILVTDPGRFDIVLCASVLHHVDIRSVLPRLLGCLNPGGLIVIVEPIALSPLLRRIRRWLPVSSHGSPDEHPLTPDEFGFVLSQLPAADVVYFRLLGRLDRFLTDPPRWLLRLDAFLLTKLPFLSRFASTVVIAARRK